MIINAIIWILKKGAPWRDLPERFAQPVVPERHDEAESQLLVDRQLKRCSLEALHQDLVRVAGLKASVVIVQVDYARQKNIGMYKVNGSITMSLGSILVVADRQRSGLSIEATLSSLSMK